jgi:hypothetical protein
VIPKTTTYKQFKEIRAREEAEAAGIPTGQTTLQNGVNGQMGVQSGSRPQSRQGADVNGVLASPVSAPIPHLNGSPMADRTVFNASHAHPGSEDVDMDS